MINLYVLLIGMGLKCYRGKFDSTEGAKQSAHWPREPALVECNRYEDVCYSGYAETEVNAGDGILPAGTWIKDCAEKSYIRDFDDIQSDRCIESKQHVVVSNMDKYLFYVTSM